MDFTNNLDKAMEYLHKQGAFLTVKNGDKTNTMTISWGNIGYEWNRPIFMALIRTSRYSYDFIKESKEFTISIPTNDKLKKALSICGTKSGRDINKFKEANIKTKDSKKLSAPIIDDCGIYYECKVVYSSDIDLSKIDKDIKDKIYSDGRFHTLFFGEIVESYEK